MNISLTDASNIIYNNNIVQIVKYNDSSVYENIIEDNYYVLPVPYYRGIGKNIYELPEYNSHTLVIPSKFNKKIEDLYFNYDSHGVHDNIWYSNFLSNVIRCDDDCFAITIDYSGSAGSGNNYKGYHITTDSSQNILYNKTLNEAWYRTAATPILEGSYSAKIYHVPADEGYTFDIILGKYGSFLASELGDWDEHGKEMAFNKYRYHSTYEDYVYSNTLDTESYNKLYTTPVHCDYYYSVINEQIYWFQDTSCNYQDRYLLYTEDIIDCISANNEVYKQTLTCSVKGNTTNNIKYQCLLYNVETDEAKPRGYLPSIYKPSYMVKSPRIIIILDPKNDELIYWGAELSSAGQWTAILKKEYTDLTLLNLSPITVDFNCLNFARISTINKLNNTLYDIDRDRKYIGDCVAYVAIPEKYYEKVIPHFLDENGDEITDIHPMLTENPYKCEFIGKTYYLYTAYSKYIDVTTSEYTSGYLYSTTYATRPTTDGPKLSKITVDII